MEIYEFLSEELTQFKSLEKEINRTNVPWTEKNRDVRNLIMKWYDNFSLTLEKIEAFFPKNMKVEWTKVSRNFFINFILGFEKRDINHQAHSYNETVEIFNNESRENISNFLISNLDNHTIEWFIKFLINLNDYINKSLSLISFSDNDGNVFQIDMSSDEDYNELKKIVNELKIMLKDIEDKNSEKFEKLNVKVTKLMDYLKKIREEMTMIELEKMKGEFSDLLIELIPYIGSKISKIKKIIRYKKIKVKMLAIPVSDNLEGDD